MQTNGNAGREGACEAGTRSLFRRSGLTVKCQTAETRRGTASFVQGCSATTLGNDEEMPVSLEMSSPNLARWGPDPASPPKPSRAGPRADRPQLRRRMGGVAAHHPEPTGSLEDAIHREMQKESS